MPTRTSPHRPILALQLVQVTRLSSVAWSGTTNLLLPHLRHLRGGHTCPPGSALAWHCVHSGNSSQDNFHSLANRLVSGIGALPQGVLHFWWGTALRRGGPVSRTTAREDCAGRAERKKSILKTAFVKANRWKKFIPLMPLQTRRHPAFPGALLLTSLLSILIHFSPSYVLARLSLPRLRFSTSSHRV